MVGGKDGLRVTTAAGSLTLAPGQDAVVGRDPSCRVHLDHDLVSRRHLVIRGEGGGWIVEDAGSLNGTFHDGQRVTRLTVDGPLDLRLGHATTGPQLDVAPVPTPPAAGTIHRPDRPAVRIGRAPENDIVLDDLLVSRHHAELRFVPGSAPELHDLGSHNGTFVNGQRVQRVALADGDLVSIGTRRWRLSGAELQEYADPGDATFAAVGLSVTVAGGTVLLDDVSFALDSRCLLAVVGPSGAGKSTLVNALTGSRPATSGSVLYAGRDLYGEYDDLRHRIGLVPQDDIVHGELTVGRAVEFAAELRFPADVTPEARRARVDEVLAELGLARSRDLAIRSLSGGQRKRASVAPELLTRPSLLFLDEPTSGLDPGYERSVMELLRGLADGGRIVAVVTHSVSSLHLCDRLLVLAPGGRVAYFGPPAGALAFFGRDDFQQVFQDLNRGDVDWPARFRASAGFARYVAGPLGQAAPAAVNAPAPAATAKGWWRQFTTLTRRYLAVIAGDRRYLGLLLLQGPLLGLLFLVALPAGQLAPSPPGELRVVSQASLVLLVVALGVTGLGASNAVREIVKELPLFRRERAVGQYASAYLASKLAVLGPLSAVQAVVIVVLGLARQNGPPDAIVLGSATGELAMAAAAGGVAAVALGLLISAVAATTDRATTLLPVILVVQLVLAVAGAGRPGLEQLGYASSTQWTLTASASTADLNRLQAGNLLLRELPAIDLDNPRPALDLLGQPDRGEPRQRHEARAWWTAMAALAVLALACLVAAGLALSRHDPALR